MRPTIKNHIAIDPSLICTAMVVNDKKFAYVGDHVMFTERGKTKQWFTKIEDIVVFKCYNMVYLEKTHTTLEIKKLSQFILICTNIVDDIESVIGTLGADSYVAIEGYSYSSGAGPLIDLVTFGSILRITLINRGLPYSNLLIAPPTDLKQKAASMVYDPIKKGKDIKYRNHSGVAGGSFNKAEMMQCLLDDPLLAVDEWVDRLRYHENDLFKTKAIAKPFEDINDAKLLYEWIKRNV